jgi:hypothetical protein
MANSPNHKSSGSSNPYFEGKYLLGNYEEYRWLPVDVLEQRRVRENDTARLTSFEASGVEMASMTAWMKKLLVFGLD